MVTSTERFQFNFVPFCGILLSFYAFYVTIVVT